MTILGSTHMRLYHGDIEAARADAALISDERYAELEAMPICERLRIRAADQTIDHALSGRSYLDSCAAEERRERTRASRAAGRRAVVASAPVTGQRSAPVTGQRSAPATGQRSAPATGSWRLHTIDDIGCSCGNYGGPGTPCLGPEPGLE